ncbi:hypothetical protein ACWGJP_08990 [Microbacterium sp. NPDC055903]
MLVVSTAGFFALAVFALGLVTVLTDADIIAVPGLGQAPGVVGMLVAIGVFAAVQAAALRITRPVYRSVWATSLATGLAHLLVVGAGALIAAGDAVTALVVMGGLVRGGASLAVVVSAAVAAWAGVALRRTRARHPRWPWEQDEE